MTCQCCHHHHDSPLEHPRMRQSVRWGENYVSRALNEKFYKVIKPGIFAGFILKPAGVMRVCVQHAKGENVSVAVVERDGYSITVLMDGAGDVAIPAKGEWFICLEAFYTPNQQGYQRIVAREEPESYHVILGKVVVTTDAAVLLPLTDENITDTGRMDANLASAGDLNEVLKFNAGLLKNLIRLTGRVFALEISSGETAGLLLPQSGFSPEPGTLVTPVTVVDADKTESRPLEAGLTFVLSEFSTTSNQKEQSHEHQKDA